MEELFKILTVVFLSAFKMIGGVPLALVYGYSFLETVIISSFGGILSIIVFTYFNTWIIRMWKRYRKKKVTKKLIFSKRNKMIVRVKQKYGIIGLSFITPLLTIPVGTFLLVRYFHNKRKIILFASVSIVFWSALTASVKLIFPDFFDYISIW